MVMIMVVMLAVVVIMIVFMIIVAVRAVCVGISFMAVNGICMLMRRGHFDHKMFLSLAEWLFDR